MRFRDLNIGTRLFIAFGGVTLLVAVLGATAVTSLNGLSKHWGQFSDTSLQKYRIAATAKAELGNTVHAFKNFIMRGQDYNQKSFASLARIDDFSDQYEKIGHLSGVERDALDKVKTGTQSYRSSIEKVATMRAEGKEIAAIDAAISGADKQISQALDVLSNSANEETTVTSAAIDNLVEQGKNLTEIIACGVLIFSVLFAWTTSRSITRPLRHAVRTARAVASGDLTSQIEPTSKDETGILLGALRDMNNSLASIVGKVRNNTEIITAGSTQIASGNQDLSARTEEQASSLEQTAASLEQLTVAVRQNANHAQEANTLASSASAVASQGGSIFNEVVATMSTIRESAHKIENIISVIDGIAFQTNILALNAAVEAARAGEQGRGFAVVASEVRSLAQRSSAAAKEIKILIGESVAAVENGNKLVSDAGNTMTEVVSSIQRVAPIMSEIMAANQEQSLGIEQVNQAISQMDQVTQQNAALVEEAAAAAESLQNQALNLAQAVAVFKLTGVLMQPQSTPAKSHREVDITPDLLKLS